MSETTVEEQRELLEQALFEIKRVIAGQDEMLERVLVCLLAGGHLLIEGVPGLAKTLTIKTAAQVLGGSFQRIQFTPDLVPSDLVGTRVFRPSSADGLPSTGTRPGCGSSGRRPTTQTRPTLRRGGRACRRSGSR